METLQIVSVVLEAVIAIIALLIAFQRKLACGYGFALTFIIYVYYDLARLFEWALFSDLLYPLFFVATASALLGMICLYKGAKRQSAS